MTNAGGPYKPNPVPRNRMPTKICPKCGGIGISPQMVVPGQKKNKCSVCQGSGRVPR